MTHVKTIKLPWDHNSPDFMCGPPGERIGDAARLHWEFRNYDSDLDEEKYDAPPPGFGWDEFGRDGVEWDGSPPLGFGWDGKDEAGNAWVPWRGMAWMFRRTLVPPLTRAPSTTTPLKRRKVIATRITRSTPKRSRRRLQRH